MKKWIFVAGAAAVGVGVAIGATLYKKVKDELLFGEKEEDIFPPKSYVTVKPAAKQAPAAPSPAPEVVKPAADENVKNGDEKEPAAAVDVGADDDGNKKSSSVDAAAKLKARKAKNAAKNAAKAEDGKEAESASEPVEAPVAAADAETEEKPEAAEAEAGAEGSAAE